MRMTMMFARTGSGHRRCAAIACSAPCFSLLFLLIPCSRPLLFPVLVPVISAGLFRFLALFQGLASFARLRGARTHHGSPDERARPSTNDYGGSYCALA